MANGISSVFRSGNPTINQSVFDNQDAARGMETMTLQGTIDKIGLLILLVLAGGAFDWMVLHNPLLLVGAIPVFIAALIIILLTGIILYFKPSWSPVLAPLFAISEGILLGGSAIWTEQFYHGVVIQAIGLTIGVMCAMFFLYKSGIIKVNNTFLMVVGGATLAIFLLYLVEFILGVFFHIQVPYINGSGPVGIGFSLVVVAVAALNLVMDFEFISQYCNSHSPKYMEWYGAYALLVTLVWVYIEILRLLIKTRNFNGNKN